MDTVLYLVSVTGSAEKKALNCTIGGNAAWCKRVAKGVLYLPKVGVALHSGIILDWGDVHHEVPVVTKRREP
jgi:hypothetical protein